MTTNGDNRLLHDIEGMERFMDDDRGWTRCRGCVRLRSTTDRNGVCDQCRPGVADGTIVLASRGIDTPVPARLVPVADPEPPTLDEEAVHEHVPDPGWIDRGDPIAPAPSEPMVAEPKQKPVKRRWYRRRP